MATAGRTPVSSRPADGLAVAEAAMSGAEDEMAGGQDGAETTSDTSRGFWQLTNWRQKAKLLLAIGISFMVLSIILLALSSVESFRFRSGFDPGMALCVFGVILIVLAIVLFIKAPKDGVRTSPYHIPGRSGNGPLVLAGTQRPSTPSARVAYRKELQEEYIRIESDLQAADIGPRANTLSDIQLSNTSNSNGRERDRLRRLSRDDIKIKSLPKLPPESKTRRSRSEPRPQSGHVLSVPSYTQPVMPKY